MSWTLVKLTYTHVPLIRNEMSMILVNKIVIFQYLVSY